jgi:cellulose synthase/poly-beta-1,6-N-acetylglucosamine synthase-like glycosyltransferase
LYSYEFHFNKKVEMFEIIFLTAVSLYFLQTVLFSVGASKKFKKIKEEEYPTATVIVAARNEEDKILDCLVSLNELQYPEGKLDIIIVNDNSTDNTGKIIDSYITGKPKFRTIIPAGKIGNLKGKTNALAHALKIAQGEIVLTTDADCTPPKLWAKSVVSYFQKDVGMVLGYTTQSGDEPFYGMQAIDFLYLQTVAAGGANLNKPMSCIGNNMAYRKCAYEELGGYENIPFSITEDMKLMMTLHEEKKYKIVYPLDKDALMISKPLASYKEIYWQKKRWGVGGVDSKIYGYMTMASGYVAKICMLLLPFLFSAAALYLSIFKIFIDYFFIQQIYRQLNLKLKISHFIAFEIYFIIYVLLIPIIVLPSRRVKWKGREF